MNGIIYDGVKAFSLREMSDRGWKIEGATDSQVAELYEETAWLYAVIQKRANGVMSIPRVLLKGSTEVDADTLPFTFDIPDMLWRSSIALDLYAKAYLLQVKNQFKTLKVRWLYPESIALEIDEVIGLEYFERQVGAQKYTYEYDPETDMSPDGLAWVWESGMAEVGPGLPKADVALYPAMVLRAIDTMSGNFFERGAISQHFFTSPNTPVKAERTRFRKWMTRVFFGGLKTSHSVEVFGDMTPHKLGSDPKDLEMPELDKDNRRDISAIFDTSEALVTGDAGSLSRATLDRITSNWILGPVMKQADLIVDAFNHHILKPAGYELVLNPEAMTVNQEEERQRALAVSMYINAGFNPEWVAALLGLDAPKGIPMMAPEPIMLPSASAPPSGSEPDEEIEEPDEEEESEDDKALAFAQLLRYIKNGTHLKRPFRSDILTVAEIDREVGKAQDAPFPDNCWQSYP